LIDIQTISIVLACASISIAALYYSFTLRYTRMNLKNTLETRQAQLFMQIYTPFASKELQHCYRDAMLMQWENYEDWRRKYYDQDSGSGREAYESSLAISHYFEGIGMLVQQGLLDISFVESLMASHVIRLWTKMEPVVMERRKNIMRFGVFEHLEYLYRELLEYEEKLGRPQTR